MVMLEEVVTLSSLSDKGLGEPRGPSPVCGQGKPRERTLPSERDPQLLKVTPAKPGSLGTKSPFQPEPHLQCSHSNATSSGLGGGGRCRKVHFGHIIQHDTYLHGLLRTWSS